MTQVPPSDIFTRRVCLQLDGMDAVSVRRDVAYGPTDHDLRFDLYYPPGQTDDGPKRWPAVIIVSGYPGTMEPRPTTLTYKEIGWTVSMGQLIAVCGNVAPGRVVCANGFGVARLFAVITRPRRDCVHRLRHPPPPSWFDHRVLNDVAGFQVDVLPILVLLLAIAGDALKQRDRCAAFVAHTYAARQVTSFALIENPVERVGSGRET